MKILFTKTPVILSGFIILMFTLFTNKAFAYDRSSCPLVSGAVMVSLNYKDKEPTLRPVTDENLNPGGGSSIKGLTITHSNLTFNTTVQIIKTKNGRYCGIPHKVIVNFIFDKIDIKYQKKYPVGSCQHNVILAHEHKHVAIYKKNGLIYSQQIKDAVEYKARHLPPEFGYNPQDVRDKVSRNLVRAATTAYNAMKHQNSKQNAVLDTKKNYLRETKKCATW